MALAQRAQLLLQPGEQPSLKREPILGLNPVCIQLLPPFAALGTQPKDTLQCIIVSRSCPHYPLLGHSFRSMWTFREAPVPKSPQCREFESVPGTGTAHKDGWPLPLAAEQDFIACGCGQCPVTNMLERRPARPLVGWHVRVCAGKLMALMLF